MRASLRRAMPFDLSGIELGVGDVVKFIDHEGGRFVGVIVSMAGDFVTINEAIVSRIGGSMLHYNIPGDQCLQLCSMETREGGKDAV